MNTYQRIGIVTDGQDCPGIATLIEAIAQCAAPRPWQLHRLSLDPGELLATYAQLQLDSVIAIGGSRTLSRIYDLAQMGNWSWNGIPATIDNTVPFTDQSLGFDSAINAITQELCNLRYPAANPNEILTVQVAGDDGGHLAIHGGIAGKADVVLIPENTPLLQDYTIAQVYDHLAQIRLTQSRLAIVVIAEGVRNSQGLREKHIGNQLVRQLSDYRDRLCATGHPECSILEEVTMSKICLDTQLRVHPPSASDRLLAALFAKKAVDLISNHQFNRLITWSAGTVASQSLDWVIPLIQQRHRARHCTSPVDPGGLILQTAQDLNMYIGERLGVVPQHFYRLRSV